MDVEPLVHSRVHEYYWAYDWNCAVTTLRVLAEVFGVTLSARDARSRGPSRPVAIPFDTSFIAGRLEGGWRRE